MARDPEARRGAAVGPGSAAGMTRASELAGELRALAANLEAEALDGIEAIAPLERSTGMAAFARRMHGSRRMLDRLIGEDVSSDPALHLLLVMFAAGAGDAALSHGDACAAADVPPQTGLRWLRLLDRRGLAREMPPRRSGEPARMTLTDLGKDAIGAYLEAVAEHAGSTAVRA